MNGGHPLNNFCTSNLVPDEQTDSEATRERPGNLQPEQEPFDFSLAPVRWNRYTFAKPLS